MEIKTRHLGSYGGRPASSIEVTISINNSAITEDVTNLNGEVDESLIQSLKDLVWELEEQNEKLKQNQK